MIKGACYVRVSTENQLENYSIEEQTERLKAFCLAKDIEISGFYTDGGCSGGNLNRPELQRLLADISKHKIDAVIVYKLDRLSRSQKDTLMLIEDHFLHNSVDFISVNENFDTSTPFGRAMIGILSVFAQLEKDQITERFTMGRIGRAKSGYYHGGAYAPTGYDYIDGNLVVNEYEAAQIRELFTRFAAGHSLHSCREYLEQRYRNKYSSWKSETLVRNALQNEIYIGNVKFGGRIYRGNHQPLIADELFQKVQLLLRKRRQNPPRSPFKARTLLTGLLYCGKCGARCHGEHGNYSCCSRTKGDRRYIKDPDCRNKKWKIPELDALVTEQICRLHFETPDTVPAITPVRPDSRSRIAALDQQIDKLLDLYQVDQIPLEAVSRKLAGLHEERDFLEQNAAAEAVPEELLTAVSLREQLRAVLTFGALGERRTCLLTLIEKILIDDDKITIILNF